jgi:hypothetical protein
VNPSIKHGAEKRILHGIEIRLDHFPEEVQKEGPETEAYFRNLPKLISFQEQFQNTNE